MEKTGPSRSIPDPDVVPERELEPTEYRNIFKERAGPSEVQSESSSSKHEQHQPNDTKIEIKQLEEILGASLNLIKIHEPVSQCIYKVPKDLRKINEEAYTPQVISIGPFHHGKTELSEMENKKLKYVLEFIEREGAEKLKELKKFILVNEQLIRNYYQENSSLTSHEFVNMILCDAVFIIEFFLKNANAGPKDRRDFDFCLDTTCVKAAITRDLQLLENQLPYFLLLNLFVRINDPNFKEDQIVYLDHEHDLFLILSHQFFFDPKDGVPSFPFSTLSYQFFSDLKDGVLPEPNDQIQQYKIQHFTDLRRFFLLMDFLPQDQQQGAHVRYSHTVKHVRDLPTATKLHGSGVKFKKGIEGMFARTSYTGRGSISRRSSLKISYKECAKRIPGFKGCEIPIPFIKEIELQIPRFEIDDRSECLYRNMMALELCHYPDETHICNFILLMDFLINTEQDVDLFVEEGIIFGLLGDNAAVAKMFNNLGLQITPSHSVYHDICKKLKAHYDGRWNRTMANLKNVYFGDIWTGTATGAAIILLVLTFIQAVCSILFLSLL